MLPVVCYVACSTYRIFPALCIAGVGGPSFQKVVCVCVGGGEPFALASGLLQDCLSVNLQLVFKVDSRKEKEGKQCLLSNELKIRDNPS